MKMKCDYSILSVLESLALSNNFQALGQMITASCPFAMRCLVAGLAWLHSKTTDLVMP